MISDIDKALISAFVSGAFGLDIVHENAPEEQKQPPYVVLQVLHGPRVSWSLSDLDVVTGVFQFDLRYPLNEGAYAAKEKRSEILSAFPLGHEVSHGGQTAVVESHWSVSNRPDGNAYLVIGRINWSAYVPRNS